jgi:uncharacterized protein
LSQIRILWRRLDAPGHEAAGLTDDGDAWRLEGSAVFLHEDEPCRLDYRVVCDKAWRTRSVNLDGWIGARMVDLEIAVAAGGEWRLNGDPVATVHGCADVDLNFSPSTNLLPIRRLRLDIGEAAAVRAAWLRFPSLTLEPLEQVYRRIDERSYAYESGGGAFAADLEVDETGFVTHYPGLWQVETFAQAGPTAESMARERERRVESRRHVMALQANSKIFPHLWYAREAEEAARFYTWIFPDSRVDRVTPLLSESPSSRFGCTTILTGGSRSAGWRRPAMLPGSRCPGIRHVLEAP